MLHAQYIRRFIYESHTSRITKLWKSVEKMENELGLRIGCTDDCEDPDWSAWDIGAMVGSKDGVLTDEGQEQLAWLKPGTYRRRLELEGIAHAEEMVEFGGGNAGVGRQAVEMVETVAG
jgi:hypothetical protein